MKTPVVLFVCFFIAGMASSQVVTPNLRDSSQWRLVSINAISEIEEGISFRQNERDGMVILKNLDFNNGSIELDIKGEDKQGASFVGISFNIQSPDVYESVYFRPFNFKNEERKTHAVQYVFNPVYTWNVLRQHVPDKYENKLEPAPDPNQWFHVRITINNSRIKAFVNNESSPCLDVKSLSEFNHGSLGLWIGPNSLGSFKNLKITSTPNPTYGYNDAVGKYFEVEKNTRLYYEEYGEGPPLLMLHGGVYGYIDEFTPFIKELSKDFRVICLGTRGHVKSDIGNEPFTFNQRASDAKKLLDHLGVKRASVIGFSDGGFAAYKLAANYPGVVDKMVVIGAGDRPAGSGVDYGYSAKKLMEESGDYFKTRVAAMREPGRWDESLQMLTRLYKTEVVSKETFEKIKCPVLLMAGDQDQYFNPASINSVHAAIPDSRLAIIPGCGHVVFYCNWDAVWATVKPFLEIKL